MASKKNKILKEVNKLLKTFKQDERSFFESLATDPKANEKLQKYVTTWSELYSLSFLEFMAMFAVAAGAAPILEHAAQHSDPLDAKESFLKQIENFELSTEFLETHLETDEAQKFLASFIIALQFNIKALAHRNRTICDMLEQIRTGVTKHEEIIFEAISIDPSVITNSEIAEYISRWTFERNQIKLDHLSKAIVGDYPRGNRMVGLDDFRLMIAALEDIEGNASAESVYQMNQLLNLVAEGNDPLAAFQKHLQRRKKDTRTSNGQSTS
ncbi:hypothetical protein [Pseudidiomarina donghaiensis]|uniref:hypothetical protein n=1 Tax=Pseudidiomarina donghaiensis TaxID=519452 RepID=UPI003A980380